MEKTKVEDIAITRYLPDSAIEAQLRFLQGEVLTIIDASQSDATQRKAIKDLINGVFSKKMDYVRDLAYQVSIPTERKIKGNEICSA